MGSITMKGREIPLVYTTWEMKEIQEELGPLSKAIRTVLGRNPEDEEDTSLYGSAEHLKAMAALIRILGNAGLEEAGENPDLTDKKVLRALKPAEMINAINACMEAMNEGMSSEIPQKKKTGPVDVVLEEIEKKKERTD
ncbi:MAG: hypothetical protein IIY60_00860 [Clostridia bacterium]|nr:hypothetical protein [Clostridia bacterium]